MTRPQKGDWSTHLLRCRTILISLASPSGFQEKFPYKCSTINSHQPASSTAPTDSTGEGRIGLIKKLSRRYRDGKRKKMLFCLPGHQTANEYKKVIYNFLSALNDSLNIATNGIKDIVVVQSRKDSFSVATLCFFFELCH